MEMPTPCPKCGDTVEFDDMNPCDRCKVIFCNKCLAQPWDTCELCAALGEQYD